MDTRHTPPLLRISLLVFMLLCLAAPRLVAQDEAPEGAGRKRVEDFRKIKLMEALEMKEEQSIRYFSREKEFRDSEREMMEQRRSILERMRSLVKDGSDADLQKEMAALIQLGKDMVQQRADFFSSLKDLLSTKQMATLMIFEDNFAKELRRVLQSPKARERMRPR